MSASRTAFAPNRWTKVDTLRVVELKMNGDLARDKTVLIEPPVGGSVDVAYRDTFIGYRLRDVNGDITEVGLLPDWRVVEAVFT